MIVVFVVSFFKTETLEGFIVFQTKFVIQLDFVDCISQPVAESVPVADLHFEDAVSQAVPDLQEAVATEDPNSLLLLYK